MPQKSKNVIQFQQSPINTSNIGYPNKTQPEKLKLRSTQN